MTAVNKIIPKIAKGSCYVFHMLSCAGCGYDNDYGRKYASIHSESSLAALKKREKLITVKGGEHFGQLYWIIVCVPAAIETAVDLYYNQVYSLFNTKSGDIMEYFNPHGFSNPLEVYDKWADFAHDIAVISKIMADNYVIYLDRAWETERIQLLPYAEKIKKAFDTNGVSSALEEYVGVIPNTDFYPYLCNSVDGGAEAIDVSANKHVFGIGRDVESEVRFIAHEYVIFLLKHVFTETIPLSEMMRLWIYTESLAAFYLYKVFNEKHFFLGDREQYIELYNKLHAENPSWTAKELLAAATSQIE